MHGPRGERISTFAPLRARDSGIEFDTILERCPGTRSDRKQLAATMSLMFHGDNPPHGGDWLASKSATSKKYVEAASYIDRPTEL
jgi:hypothetical protein